MVLPQLNDDSEFLAKKHLPVYARFPFDISVSVKQKKIKACSFFFNKIKKEKDHILMVTATAVIDYDDNTYNFNKRNNTLFYVLNKST